MNLLASLTNKLCCDVPAVCTQKCFRVLLPLTRQQNAHNALLSGLERPNLGVSAFSQQQTHHQCQLWYTSVAMTGYIRR